MTHHIPDPSTGKDPPVTSPALHPDVILTKLETIRCWADLMPGRSEFLGSWKASRLEDGHLFLSVQVHGPDPGQALHRFADRQAGYLSRRPQEPGDQLPALDVTVPDREACVWRTGGVWVELWHPLPTSVPAAPARPVPAPPPSRGLLGARLPIGRRKTTA